MGTRRAGRTRLTIKGLAPGRHTITVHYRGDADTLPSRDTVRVEVPRRG